MNMTFLLSAVSLGLGAMIFVLSIALLGTPPLDIGMLSTAAVFVLFGAFGLLLSKAQADTA